MKLLALRMIVLLLGIAFGLSAGSEYRILSECDGSANVRANISKDAQLEIHFAIAGTPTCYSVTATVDGKQVRGYVLNSDLDAILAFDKARMKVSRDTLEASQAPLQPSVQIANPGTSSAGGAKAAAAEKPPATEKSGEAEKPADTEKPVNRVPKAKGPIELPR